MRFQPSQRWYCSSAVLYQALQLFTVWYLPRAWSLTPVGEMFSFHGVYTFREQPAAAATGAAAACGAAAFGADAGGAAGASAEAAVDPSSSAAHAAAATVSDFFTGDSPERWSLRWAGSGRSDPVPLAAVFWGWDAV
ncbi:hypothetical protein [Streptomyces sp. NPDC052494]|uniref:hypothetical protein n=1 Tax=Streptomyces sp. NPDC052494 TaxID=3365692 RepID=UPI0037CD948E